MSRLSGFSASPAKLKFNRFDTAMQAIRFPAELADILIYGLPSRPGDSASERGQYSAMLVLCGLDGRDVSLYPDLSGDNVVAPTSTLSKIHHSP